MKPRVGPRRSQIKQTMVRRTGNAKSAERQQQTDANRRRPAGAVTIGTTEMTIGFAENWLAWHDCTREASEDKRHTKHWLDWAGWVVAVISMCIAAFTTIARFLSNATTSVSLSTVP